tara:strand:+ start:170 stop:469 length:300 start_codon:yes stop_codon:yes gene_type:complete
MVIAKEVQDTVDNEMGKVGLRCFVLFDGFTKHGLIGDCNIANQFSGRLAGGIDSYGRRGSMLQRKCQDIGALIPTAKLGVEASNPGVIGERDTNLNRSG